MSRVSGRTARLTAWAAIPVALIVSGVVVSTASYSAFSATTANPSSNWSAGSVSLTDDDEGAAMFNATGLTPGSSGQNCVTVTSKATVPSTVKVYATAGSDTSSDLAEEVTLTIQQGTGGGFGSCGDFIPATTGGSLYSGSLADFASTHTDFATGVDNWVPSTPGPDSRVYEISYSLPETASSAGAGESADLGFTWEEQNS